MNRHRRIALVIGGANGLGKAISQALARNGIGVSVADLNHAAAQEVVSALGAAGGSALRMDLADVSSIRAGIQAVAQAEGGLDILINCAAICLVDPLLEVSPERWDKVFAVNARGAFFSMQEAAKIMIPRKWGRIIEVSSPASRLGFPLFASYGASKAAVDSMIRSAAVALAPHGITVNCIVPGRMTGGMIDALEQDIAKVTGKDMSGLAEERTKALPMGRRVAPEEVAEAAIWLSSEAASYVTAERFNFTGAMEMA
jgi:3-oxoacyl-[acyl-carrier protein] reductase